MSKKILVCGDRYYDDREEIYNTLLEFPRDTIVIHGACRGVDTIAGEVAQELGMSVMSFPADWTRYGRAAGPMRNKKMLEQDPEVVLAFHKDLEHSRGTKNTIEQALKREIVVILYD